MASCACTECGCEATAATIDLIEAMGWVVLADGLIGEVAAAVCARCRREVGGSVTGSAFASLFPVWRPDEVVATSAERASQEPSEPRDPQPSAGSREDVPEHPDAILLRVLGVPVGSDIVRPEPPAHVADERPQDATPLRQGLPPS